jgi:hypothetical protein
VSARCSVVSIAFIESDVQSEGSGFSSQISEGSFWWVNPVLSQSVGASLIGPVVSSGGGVGPLGSESIGTSDGQTVREAPRSRPGPEVVLVASNISFSNRLRGSGGLRNLSGEAQVSEVVLGLSSDGALAAEGVRNIVVSDVAWDLESRSRDGLLGRSRSNSEESSLSWWVAVSLVIGDQSSDKNIDGVSAFVRSGEGSVEVNSFEPSRLSASRTEALFNSDGSNNDGEVEHPPSSIGNSSFIGNNFDLEFIAELVVDGNVSNNITSAFSDEVENGLFASLFSTVVNANSGGSAVSSSLVGNSDGGNLSGSVSTRIS